VLVLSGSIAIERRYARRGAELYHPNGSVALDPDQQVRGAGSGADWFVGPVKVAIQSTW